MAKRLSLQLDLNFGSSVTNAEQQRVLVCVCGGGGAGGWHHIGLLRAKCHEVSQSSIAHSNSYDFRFGLSYHSGWRNL